MPVAHVPGRGHEPGVPAAGVLRGALGFPGDLDDEPVASSTFDREQRHVEQR